MSQKTLIALNILIVVAFVGVVSAFAQTPDVTPPIISVVSTTDITQTSATVNWTTDEPADGQVEYGTSTTYGLTSVFATATTTAHHIVLNSLTASTTYHYLVKSKDAAGNLATSTDYTFDTLPIPVTDTTAPVISEVTVSGISNTAATINWTTDEPADSQVEYGTSTAYDLASALVAATTTAHHVALGSLTASTTYHFHVQSKDAASNLATSTDYTFATIVAPAPINTAVRVSVEPRVLNIASRGNWITAQVTFARGTDPQAIDLSSFRLNGALTPTSVQVSKTKWYEVFFNILREPKVTMKFSRNEVIDLLLSTTTATSSSSTLGWSVSVKNVTISGTAGGKTFAGTTPVYLLIKDGQGSPVVLPHKIEKKEKHEEKEKKKHEENNEHEAFEHFATSTQPTATTTDAMATTTNITATTTQTTVNTEDHQNKEEKGGWFRNPFNLIPTPFSSLRGSVQQRIENRGAKMIQKEDQKNEKKENRNH